MDLLADDVMWHVPGRNLLSRDYVGKAEVTAFWARADGLSVPHIRRLPSNQAPHGGARPL